MGLVIAIMSVVGVGVGVGVGCTVAANKANHKHYRAPYNGTFHNATGALNASSNNTIPTASNLYGLTDAQYLAEWHKELKVILIPVCVFVFLVFAGLIMYIVLSKRKARKMREKLDEKVAEPGMTTTKGNKWFSTWSRKPVVTAEVEKLTSSTSAVSGANAGTGEAINVAVTAAAVTRELV